MTLESDFSKKVVSFLESVGAVVNVNTATIFDRVGRSDLEACYRGYYIALELKTGNYQPEPLQISYLQKIRDAGGYALLLRDNLNDVQDLIWHLHDLENGRVYPYAYEQPELPDITEDKLEVYYD